MRLPLERAHRWLVGLGLAALGLRLLAVGCVWDWDSDPYGHYVIAHALVQDPGALAAHWVWLPSWHYVFWAILKLGLGFQGARVFNAALQCAAPLVFWDYLRRSKALAPEKASRLALLASLLLTLAPLSNLLAVEAQMETLFTLSLLGLLWALGQKRYVLSGLLAALACLTRYEGWAVMLVLGPFELGLAWLSSQGSAKARMQALFRRLPLIALPLAGILGWAALRAPIDGQFFGFVLGVRQFAVDSKGSELSPSVWEWLWDLARYPLLYPAMELGPAVLMLGLGLGRWVRKGMAREWLMALALLGFLMASAVGRGSLGLLRHLTPLMPFLCLAVAHGVLFLEERFGQRRRFAALALGTAACMLLGHGAWLFQTDEKRFHAAKQAASWLREHGQNSLIWCSDVSIEAHTGLSPQRFVRRPPQAWCPADKRQAQGYSSLYLCDWEQPGKPISAEPLVRFAQDPSRPQEKALVIWQQPLN